MDPVPISFIIVLLTVTIYVTVTEHFCKLPLELCLHFASEFPGNDNWIFKGAAISFPSGKCIVSDTNRMVGRIINVTLPFLSIVRVWFKICLIKTFSLNLRDTCQWSKLTTEKCIKPIAIIKMYLDHYRTFTTVSLSFLKCFRNTCIPLSQQKTSY